MLFFLLFFFFSDCTAKELEFGIMKVEVLYYVPMTKGLMRCAVNPAPLIVYEKPDFLILQLKYMLSFEVLT